jgi:hypothetical protein
MTHAQVSAAPLAGHGKRLDQQIVQRLACIQALSKLGRLIPQLFVAVRMVLGSSALIASTLGCSFRSMRALAEPNSAVMPRSKRPRMPLKNPATISQIRSNTSIMHSNY